MLPEIKLQYNQRILDWFIQRYGADGDAVRFLGDSDSYVYEINLNNESYIMKITHSNRRSAEYLQGEIDWLNYLADNGAAVARAIPSMHGNQVEVLPLENNSYFLASIYEKAPGQLPTEQNWNVQLFEEWGRAVGKIHALSRLYKISNPAWMLIDWCDEDFINVEKYIPASQEIVIRKSTELMKRLRNIPKLIDDYGLIHGDMLYHNFHWSDQGIVLFDFDDVTFNHYINDLAVILIHIYWKPLKEHTDRQQFVAEFLSAFLRGYNKENSFKAEWFGYIADFIRARHLLGYIAFYRECAIDLLSEEEANHLAILRKYIEEDLPIVDYDFVGRH